MSNSSYYEYHPTLQLERPVVLGGMPGTPYREVGHYLTSLTGLSLVDLDRWLEHQVGESLWDFMQSEGEHVLRQKEFEYLDRALVAEPCGLLIVSEGALAQAANRRRIGESASLVYLSSAPSSAYWQVRQQISERGPRYHPHVPQPLTHFDVLRPLIEALDQAREDADLVLAVDNRSVQDLVDTIFDAMPSLHNVRSEEDA